MDNRKTLESFFELLVLIRKRLYEKIIVENKDSGYMKYLVGQPDDYIVKCNDDNKTFYVFEEIADCCGGVLDSVKTSITIEEILMSDDEWNEVIKNIKNEINSGKRND